METTYDLSTEHPTSLKLTNEILESSELVMDSLLAELPCQLLREQTSGNAVNVTAILKSVVSLVNSGLVARSKEAVVVLQSVVTLVSSYMYMYVLHKFTLYQSVFPLSWPIPINHIEIYD